MNPIMWRIIQIQLEQILQEVEKETLHRYKSVFAAYKQMILASAALHLFLEFCCYDTVCQLIVYDAATSLLSLWIVFYRYVSTGLIHLGS